MHYTEAAASSYKVNIFSSQKKCSLSILLFRWNWYFEVKNKDSLDVILVAL